MARSRTMPRPEAPLPEGDHEVRDITDEVDPKDMPKGWQLAYDRAVIKGCSPKGARLYADAHGEDFEPGEGKREPTVDEMKLQLAELSERLNLAEQGQSGNDET